jgi:peroxiredoxin Q/BCP
MNAYRDQYAKLFNNGHGVVLIAISADPDTALASWARDSKYPFLFASDSETKVARQYGALADQPGLTNRNLFVVGRDGKIAYRAIPFREIDQSAYTQLGAAIDSLAPETESGGGKAGRR